MVTVAGSPSLLAGSPRAPVAVGHGQALADPGGGGEGDAKLAIAEELVAVAHVDQVGVDVVGRHEVGGHDAFERRVVGPPVGRRLAPVGGHRRRSRRSPGGRPGRRCSAPAPRRRAGTGAVHTSWWSWWAGPWSTPPWTGVTAGLGCRRRRSARPAHRRRAAAPARHRRGSPSGCGRRPAALHDRARVRARRSRRGPRRPTVERRRSLSSIASMRRRRSGGSVLGGFSVRPAAARSSRTRGSPAPKGPARWRRTAASLPGRTRRTPRWRLRPGPARAT